MKNEKLFTQEDMELCFSAGYDFAKDMFNNPSNTEYINEILAQKQANEANKSDKPSINNNALLVGEAKCSEQLPKCEHKHIEGGDGCFTCVDCGASDH